MAAPFEPEEDIVRLPSPVRRKIVYPSIREHEQLSARLERAEAVLRSAKAKCRCDTCVWARRYLSAEQERTDG